MQNPYLYSREGRIASEEQVRTILAEGYQEAFIDLIRCDTGCLPPDLAALLPSVSGQAYQDPPPPKVALAEELPAAKGIYQDAMFYAHSLMDSMRQGSFDMPAAESVVENILSSVDRNADALFGLCKLRQTDSYTYTHCVNVSVLSVMFARGMGALQNQLHAIGMGGLFHDLGKSLIPLHILNAPRRLTEPEFQVMQSHPTLGYEQLRKITDVPPEVLQIVIEHHEKHNGEGYPRKLPGAAISFAGKIAAIVDVYDALTSRRVYKEPMSLSKSLGILYSMRAKDLHPEYVEHFIRLLGVYPIGSAVELEDGTRAVVAGVNHGKPLLPTVRMVKDKAGHSLALKEVNLAEQGTPAVAKSISPQELGVDPGKILGLFA
jgi:putative nucleotidyltransferase with HDIG domain